MNWEKLTSVEFAEAVKKTDVCIIAFGVFRTPRRSFATRY